MNLPEVVGQQVFEDFKRYKISLSRRLVSIEDHFRRFLGIASLDADFLRRTRVYFVGRGSAGNKPCPTAFMIPLGGFIFINERPENIRGVQRFCLLHEMGHLSTAANHLSLRARYGCPLFLFLWLWMIPQIGFHGYKVFIVVFLGLVLTNLRDILWASLREMGEAYDEIVADRFALSNLDEGDLVEAAAFFSEWPIPRDPSLDAIFGKARCDILAENLRHAREHGGKLETLWIVPQRTLFTELPTWICLCIAAVLALITSPASVDDVYVMALLTSMLFIFCWFYKTVYKRLERWVDLVLAGPEAIPAETVGQWPKEPSFLKRLRVFLGIEPHKISAAKL